MRRGIPVHLCEPTLFAFLMSFRFPSRTNFTELGIHVGCPNLVERLNQDSLTLITNTRKNKNGSSRRKRTAFKTASACIGALSLSGWWQGCSLTNTTQYSCGPSEMPQQRGRGACSTSDKIHLHAFHAPAEFLTLSFSELAQEPLIIEHAYTSCGRPVAFLKAC